MHTIAPSPHNPNYTWLHPAVKELIQQKQGKSHPYGWQADQIQYLLFEPFPHPERMLVVGVNNVTYWKSLHRLSITRLLALDEFMTQREEECSQHQPLVNVRSRATLTNQLVLVRLHPYASGHVGRILKHSKDSHCSHLGDCWLVQFKSNSGDWGNTHYIPADQVFQLNLPNIQVQENTHADHARQ